MFTALTEEKTYDVLCDLSETETKGSVLCLRATLFGKVTLICDVLMDE